MNEATYTEFKDNSIKITRVDESNFPYKLEPFCKSSFKEKTIKTFAFILNNNESNYFAELLSNDQFIETFDKLSGDDLSVIWCEPQVIEGRVEKTSYEFIVKTNGGNPKKLWMSLFRRLYPDQINSLKTNDFLPAIFLMKVEKGASSYQLLDVVNFQLKDLERFENILAFQKNIFNFFKLITEHLKLDDTELFHEDFYQIDKIGYAGLISRVSNTVKNQNGVEVKLKDLYPNLSLFISDLIDNVDITDLV